MDSSASRYGITMLSGTGPYSAERQSRIFCTVRLPSTKFNFVGVFTAGTAQTLVAQQREFRGAIGAVVIGEVVVAEDGHRDLWLRPFAQTQNVHRATSMPGRLSYGVPKARDSRAAAKRLYSRANRIIECAQSGDRIEVRFDFRRTRPKRRGSAFHR